MATRRELAERIVNALGDHLRATEQIDKVYALQDKNNAVKAAAAARDRLIDSIEAALEDAAKASQ